MKSPTIPEKLRYPDTMEQHRRYKGAFPFRYMYLDGLFDEILYRHTNVIISSYKRVKEYLGPHFISKCALRNAARQSIKWRKGKNIKALGKAETYTIDDNVRDIYTIPLRIHRG